MNNIILHGLETPCYVIDYQELDYNYNNLKAAFSKHWQGPLCIGYSVKTNHVKWILEYMKQKGALAEVVSNDEYLYAELLGYTPNDIIFNGPNKSEKMLEHAIKNGSIVNIDSFSELKKICLLKDINNIKVGLRVNFDLEIDCPGESAMGMEPSRFGFSIENGDFKQALEMCNEHNINVNGIHMHQSTKTRSVKVFQALAKKATECIREYGLKDSLAYLDIGGGFFGGRDMENKPTFEDYAKIIYEELNKAVDTNNTLLIIEPGASLISTPISYFTKVIDVKDVRGNRLVTVDGSLLHVNPFLVPRKPSYRIFSKHEKYYKRQTICGSTCMENDRLFFIEDSSELDEGDIIEIEKCGSYTMCYNSCFINLPPTIYVKKEGQYEIVRDKWKPERLL
jgi:diaminopimelate decarboxylase